RLDDLLARLAEAFEREKRFSSDVAHELRTPVAELRSLAEVAHRWPEDRHATQAFFADVGAVAAQMEELIGNLLALARSDAGADALWVQEVSLAAAVKRAWERQEPRAAERGVTLDLAIDGDDALFTDAAKLDLILANLLANAAAYAPVGSPVSCRGEVDGQRFRLAIANAAPQLDPGDLPLLGQRFWRKDDARGDGRHAGLGLTLVRSLANALGYAVDFRLDGERRFTVEVSGPRVLAVPAALRRPATSPAAAATADGADLKPVLR
ncbi:MAG TPA: ATP-binding protein, partial [Thermoanaerobaculia bacterium]|nr:ATP-binding protein [Thermoanaerobaculia bacterium]